MGTAIPAVVPAGTLSARTQPTLHAAGRWAIDELGLHRLTLVHAVANAASCRVAQKCDFLLEGTMRSHQLLADGWHDTPLHAWVAAADAHPPERAQVQG